MKPHSSAACLVATLLVGIVGHPCLALAQPPGWGPDTRLTNHPTFQGFSATVGDPAGNVSTVYQSTQDGNAEIYFVKTDPSGSLVFPAVRITTNPALSWFPKLARDASGNLHVVWMDTEFGNAEIHYAKVDGTTGAILVAPTRITNDPADSTFPTVAVDASGNVHVVWAEGRDGNAELYWQKRDNNGALLVPDTRITNDPAISWQPAVSIDPNGNVDVVWTDDRLAGAPQIFYKKVNGTNGTTIVADIALTSVAAPGEAAFPSVSRDSSGRLHLAFVSTETGNAEIRYIRLSSSGAIEIPSTTLTTDPANSWWPAISSTGASGYPRIAWVDDRDGNLEIYFTSLNTAGATVVDDLRLTSDPAVSAIPSAVEDLYNTLRVTWNDTRDPPPGNEEIYYNRELRPTVSLAGPLTPGGTTQLNVTAPSDPNRPYICAFSTSSAPSFPLGDGRLVDLNPNDIFIFSIVSAPSAGIFNNSQGTLDANGQPLLPVTVFIPSFVPGGGLINLCFACVTMDAALAIPVVSISHAACGPIQ